MTATLVFKIIGDAKQAQTTVERFSDSMGAMQGPALIAGAAVAAGLGLAVKAASDAEQSYGAMNAVFGENTAQMAAAAESANDLGLSTAAYNQAAAITGALLKNTGTEAAALAGQTDDLIGSASDLAAQFGGSTQDALGGIQSMLKGSYEVMDNYGIKLTAASVAAYAAEHSLTPAQAAVALMNEQMAATGAQGAAAREMDTYASSTAQAQAAITDAAAAIGDDLLPLLADLAGLLKDGSNVLAGHAGAVRNAALAIGALALAVLSINAALTVARAAMVLYTAVTGALTFAQSAAAVAGWVFAAAEWAALLPIALIVVGIIALIAVIVLLVKNWDKVSGAMRDLWAWIKGAFLSVWDTIANAIGKVIDKLKAVWDWVRKILDSGIGRIADIIPGGRSSTVDTINRASTRSAAGSGPGGGTGGVTINFNGLVTDPESTARTIQRVLHRSGQRNGETS